MIDKLEMFIALAREKHFGRAAEDCRVTQPTLSSAIKQLEDQFGVMLVRRGSRYQGLTPEGQRVLEWARRIVADVRSMQEDLRTARYGLSGHLRIAAIPTALSAVAELTTPFAEAHPGITFSVLSRTSVEILSLLENLEIDVGITYLDNEPLGRVTTVPLYEERYAFVTQADGQYAGKMSITWKEVAEAPLCLLTPDMQNRRIVNQKMGEAGATANPTLESNSVITLFAHVRTGRWSSIMPWRLVEAFGPSDQLQAIPIVEPEAVESIGLVAAYREPHTPVLAALLAEARKVSQLLPREKRPSA
ncbi:LysR family transcriptional regulator [Afifella marina]|uniref:DNA-binding transcriptional regulator, LysR family n=1 Tax=Afifella marina DSM 2698 TaxID=1120955 RepID=A0A1G5MX43_AFIMA|nr:LysR family transcriptional regulator [Afifella marina]MBK1622122.1 LysR family transcriptional regulator [Afifella marina DSM 2698]MBK1628248.1 LysR family transcriptional regulator [Afifella marina]MBK5918906.1 LysR family transcriptional regulator [Afifella marina]RAI17767.1 LysR family transcriptional regulator [Afifella marina DSM 2698]SCZ29676.1 DNA-binding transcriptional regulator, LysR family [Afifella marina DSM 2698]